jgi:hypothetical protein
VQPRVTKQSTLPAKLLRHGDVNHPACNDKDINFFWRMPEKLTSFEALW